VSTAPRIMICTNDGRTPGEWPAGTYHGEPHAWDADCDSSPRCVPIDPNHVEEEKTVAQLPPQCDCSRRSDHTLGCASGLAVGVKLDAKTLESPRASALDEARRLVTGDRNNQYGPPNQDFLRTAALLNALGYHREDAEGVVHPIQSSDVAIIVAQVKVSRLMHSRRKRDSWVDLAGYAACGYECALDEEDGHA
jgi:hypothetical protein